MISTHTFSVGPKEIIQADFEMPDSWLDFTLTDFRFLNGSDPIYLSAATPDAASITDLRNFCCLEVSRRMITEWARKELVDLREARSVPNGNETI